MSEANPGPDLRLRYQPPAFAPAVRVSRRALVDNIRAALADGAGRIVDIRRDACGHGAAFVASATVTAGAAGVRIDQGDDPGRMSLAGAEAHDDDHDLIDPALVFGLPGGDGRGSGRPVMSLMGRVLLVKRLRAGEGVSYGYTYRAEADTRIALVTGGYGQGVVRSLGNRVSVAIGDHRLPIAGRVAMDVCVLEIGAAPIARGDEVRFFGDPEDGYPSLSEWVRATGLGADEIVCDVGRTSAVVEEAQ